MANKNRSFCVQVKVDATVSFNVNAESLEDAIAKAREEVKERGVFEKSVQWDDGDIEVMGVFE